MAVIRALNRKKDEAREYQTKHSGIFFKVDRVLFEGRSDFQTVEIVRNRDYGRVLFLDGLVQTTERDEFYYHEMLVHPALACHKSPRNVLIIGGGDGGALREVLKHPVEKVRMVEIDALVVEACRRHFPWLKAALRDPRAGITIGDGDAFIRETKEKFDAVIVDSSDPVGPSAVLHARNFYAALKKVLAPGGVVAAQAGSLMLHVEQHGLKNSFIRRLFRRASFYLGPVPTYPVGMWCYNFLSDDIDPLAVKRLRIPDGLKYYNKDVHRAAFVQPNFLRAALRSSRK